MCRRKQFLVGLVFTSKRLPDVPLDVLRDFADFIGQMERREGGGCAPRSRFFDSLLCGYRLRHRYCPALMNLGQVRLPRTAWFVAVALVLAIIATPASVELAEVV